MVQINFARKEINCKIVYYGPGMSGKTTNLEIVHQKTPGENKGELTCIATEGDRTLFFDFMPLNLGNIMGMNIKFQLYTVPGQVYYNSTRKLVLRGVDGVIFIADSAPDKMAENIESLENLHENLAEYGKDPADLPIVIQYNKQDLPNALSVDEMNEKLNPAGAPAFPGVASKGEGVFSTLKALSAVIIENINQKDDGKSRTGARGNSVPMKTPSSGSDHETVGSSTHHAPGNAPLPTGTSSPEVHHSEHKTAAHHTGNTTASGNAPHHHAGNPHATEVSGEAATLVMDQQQAETQNVVQPTAPQATPTRPQLSSNVASASQGSAGTQKATQGKAASHRTPVAKKKQKRSSQKVQRPAPANRTQKSQAPTDSPTNGKNWGVIFLVVFVLAFAATAFLAIFR